jgi:hypothetical protein
MAQQGAALEQTRQQLQQVQERLQQEEALSTTVEERTIAAEQQQRVTRSGDRAAAIQRALQEITDLENLVAAGSESAAAGVPTAVAQIESAATDAGKWGSTAEAGHLTAAADLLRPIPSMIATRNFQDAQVAVYAAERRVTLALALARSAAPPR